MSQSAREYEMDATQRTIVEDHIRARFFAAADTDATYPTRVVGRDLTPEACDLTTADLLGLL